MNTKENIPDFVEMSEDMQHLFAETMGRCGLKSPEIFSSDATSDAAPLADQDENTNKLFRDAFARQGRTI